MLITDELLNELKTLRKRGSDELLETRLLSAYEEFKRVNNVGELAYVVSELAHFYTVSGSKNLRKAEAYFFELEQLEPGAESKWITAGFYNAFGSPTQVIEKVNEINATDPNLACRYSALSFKGQACLLLERFDDAEETLDELLGWVDRRPNELPYGDELPFIEEASKVPALRTKCHELLKLVVPRIQERDFQDKGKKLLQSLSG